MPVLLLGNKCKAFVEKKKKTFDIYLRVLMVYFVVCSCYEGESLARLLKLIKRWAYEYL